MKKIALFIAMLAGTLTSAMAQEAATTKDSVYVVIGDSVAGAYAISDGDYVTFTRPAEWHNVITDAKTYYYYNNAYTFNYSYKTTIMQLGTTNYFYVDNFLNSGAGFYFKIKNTDGTFPTEITDISTVDGIFDPVNDEGTSVTDYGSYTFGSFYVGSSWGWTDTVNNVTYDSWSFYGGSTTYAGFYGTKKYIELMCYPKIGGNATFSTLYIDWR